MRSILEFEKKHPRAADRGIILAAYASCTGKTAESIEKAYRHSLKCNFCKARIKARVRAYKKRLYVSETF